MINSIPRAFHSECIHELIPDEFSNFLMFILLESVLTLKLSNLSIKFTNEDIKDSVGKL